MTLLFRYQQEAVFKAQMDGFRGKRRDRPIPKPAGAVASTGALRLCISPRPIGQVHLFSAYPKKGSASYAAIHKMAFERIVDTLNGPD